MEHKQVLVKLLGLGADATDDQIQNAASTFQQDVVNWKMKSEEEKEALTNSVEESKAEVATLTTERDALKVSNTAMLTELVEHDLTQFAGVISNKDDIKAKLMNDRAGTVTILKGIKISNNRGSHPPPLHDPNKAAMPNGNGTITNSGGMESVTAEDAIKISNRARELSRTLKIPHQQAFVMASGEVLKGVKA